MKLRKALDKAKQAQSDAKPTGGSPRLDEEAPAAVRRGENGWNSPAYTESKHIKPDLALMEANRCVGMFSDAPELDYYKVLRTQIEQRTKENGWNTIMVTSIRSGEGKTLTAINLGLTFARAFNRTVLLVDCDLRKQNICGYLGIENDRGLVNYLVDDQPLKDIIVWPGVDKMTLISGGRTIRDSAELLGSPRMRSLASEMKNRYEDRLVLFDVPPILAGADAIAFAPLVDCFLIVIEDGKTSMREIEHALELMPTEKFIGFVMNKQRMTRGEQYG